MTDRITPRDLFAATALHSLMPFVLQQENNDAMKEAMVLAVTSAWSTAQAMLDMRDIPSQSSDNDRPAL
jgi:hypothetical protein